MTHKFITDVNCSRGAPMGRASYGIPDNCEPRSIHLFRVPMSDSCYDVGGAYWGSGTPVYCATDGDGYWQFTRASSRVRAMLELGLYDYLPSMKSPGTRQLRAYCDDALNRYPANSPHNSGFPNSFFADILRTLDK